MQYKLARVQGCAIGILPVHSLFSTHSHTHAQHICISECTFVLTCTMCMNTHAWTIHEYIHVTQTCTSRSSFLLYTLFPPLLISPLSPPFSPLPSSSSPIHLPSSLSPFCPLLDLHESFLFVPHHFDLV